MTLQIRDATPAEAPAIAELVRQAFVGHPHSDQTEHLLVERLRLAGALTLSLVAVEAGLIVGYIAFSPVIIDGVPDQQEQGQQPEPAQGSWPRSKPRSWPGLWLGLAPVAVLPGEQKRGIGTALIEAGLTRSRALGVAGCVVLGDPAYYRRFGFRQHDGLTCLYPVPPEYFMALFFGEAVSPPRGQVRYHPAFDAG